MAYSLVRLSWIFQQGILKEITVVLLFVDRIGET